MVRLLYSSRHRVGTQADRRRLWLGCYSRHRVEIQDHRERETSGGLGSPTSAVGNEGGNGRTSLEEDLALKVGSETIL